MTVLILARELDSQVDRLVQVLRERKVPVFRTDLAAFPTALTLDARLGPDGWDGVLATEHREVRLSDIRSVLYRHPSHFEMPEGLCTPERRHAAAEARCVGAFDFVVPPDQEWIMLECNPAGAYGWLEQALDLPITSALADLLANGAIHSAHRLHRAEPARA